MSVSISQFNPPSSPCHVHMFILYVYVSILFWDKTVYTIFLDSTYVLLIIYICFYLSDLLHFVCKSLGLIHTSTYDPILFLFMTK